MNKFINDFRKWQKRFLCPKCHRPTLDFTLSDFIEAPILCINCGLHFNLKLTQQSSNDVSMK